MLFCGAEAIAVLAVKSLIDLFLYAATGHMRFDPYFNHLNPTAYRDCAECKAGLAAAQHQEAHQGA
jgi:hypothetical protein